MQNVDTSPTISGFWRSPPRNVGIDRDGKDEQRCERPVHAADRELQGGTDSKKMPRSTPALRGNTWRVRLAWTVLGTATESVWWFTPRIAVVLVI